MATISLKTPVQNDYEFSITCMSDFNNLSHQRQINILKQYGITASSFVQHVANEKKAIFSDIKQLAEELIQANELPASNTKQIERKYGEIIKELYDSKISIKTISINLGRFEQSENPDSKLKITESIIRAVINSMNIKRADDRKKGKRKTKKKNASRSARIKADAQKIDENTLDIMSADVEQIEGQIGSGIATTDNGQIRKQIDPEIENVRLDDLGTESDT